MRNNNNYNTHNGAMVRKIVFAGHLPHLMMMRMIFLLFSSLLAAVNLPMYNSNSVLVVVVVVVVSPAATATTSGAMTSTRRRTAAVESSASSSSSYKEFLVWTDPTHVKDKYHMKQLLHDHIDPIQNPNNTTFLKENFPEYIVVDAVDAVGDDDDIDNYDFFLPYYVHHIYSNFMGFSIRSSSESSSNFTLEFLTEALVDRFDFIGSIEEVRTFRMRFWIM